MCSVHSNNLNQVISSWTKIAINPIPVNPSPLRGSLPRKSLISRMDCERCKIVKYETPSGKHRLIQFKSYPRVSQILLSCTSPGVRPYMTSTPIIYPGDLLFVYSGFQLYSMFAFEWSNRQFYDVYFCNNVNQQTKCISIFIPPTTKL